MAATSPDVRARLAALTSGVERSNAAAAAAARQQHAGLAKPPGSLGQLEELGARLAGTAGVFPPPIPATPALIVCAGDHGVHSEGVTPWPQAITGIMAGVIADGAAASSVFARQVGASVTVMDAAVADHIEPRDNLRSLGVLPGATRNLRSVDAMTVEEAVSLVLAGAAVAHELIGAGADLVVTGDMGIANTTASAALVAAFTGASAHEATGRGTGIDDATLEVKSKVVADALQRLGPDREPLDVLAALGGGEHAALVGVILAGAARRVPVVLDGVIADAAALVAVALAPAAVDHLIAGHRSMEPGAALALDHLGLTALLDLDLRLGEGTGALLAVPLVQAAARVLSEMATLEELGFG